MSTELVHIGFKNFVPINRVVAVLSRGTSPSGPLKRLIEKSKAEGKLLNLTRGRKVKTVLVMDSDHIILSAISPETIVERLNEKRSQKIEGAIRKTPLRKQNSPSLLIVLSGLSGVGKDTVLNGMKKRGLPFHFAVTATTRPMRQGEKDGVDYYFVSKKKFEDMIEKGELLEWAEVYGNLYGVPKWELQRALDEEKDVIVKVDVQGAATLKKLLPEAVFIFLTAPSQNEIEKRLRERGTDEESSLKIRLEKAQSEVESLPLFDYKVVNCYNRAEEVVSQIEAIVTVEKCRVNPRTVKFS